MEEKICYLLANFGGPRNQGEVESFLRALLTDQDVVRTPLPALLHRLIFTRTAKKRAPKIAEDYQIMGGGSPIFGDTEVLAKSLRGKLSGQVITFHRYLPQTHAAFIEKMKSGGWDEIRVFPLFPQFSYATSGSIARFFEENLPGRVVNKMRWIKSYPRDTRFIEAYAEVVRTFLTENGLQQSEVTLLYSCHGIPRSFVCTGDPYKSECEASFQAIAAHFPQANHHLSYQSKFGPGEWLRPYTDEVCEAPDSWMGARKTCVVVPLSFTSDHIETLVEIERDYIPLLRAAGLTALRAPALFASTKWVDSIVDFCLSPPDLSTNSMLVRRAMPALCRGKKMASCRQCGMLDKCAQGVEDGNAHQGADGNCHNP